jgi:photosystem II stability/assembly factor-like uncharacterized protein
MVRKAVRLLLILAVLIGAAPPLRAGVNVWTPAGPDSGGAVTALAVHPADPRIVYAGTDGGGIFKTTDGGQTWQAANQGLTSLFIRALVIDPSNPDTLYAATAGQNLSFSVIAVFQSTDGGATWRDKSEGLPAGTRGCFCARLPVDVLAMDPRDPRILFTVVDGAIYRMNPRGLRWNSFPGPGARVWSLAVDSAGTVYAGTERGVFKKPLGGAWVSASAGLGERWVVTLAVHPTNPRILYAGSGPTVFKSVDAGRSWRFMSTGLPIGNVLTLEIDPGQPSIVYAGTQAGLFRSIGARRWFPWGAGIPGGHVGVVAVAPSDSNILYAGTGPLNHSGPGVFKSADGGANWQVLRRGITAGIVTSLAASRTPPQALYAGTEGQGVFRTDNGGGSWVHVSNGLTDPFIRSLAVDPTDSRTVYAGTRTGVFKTTDGGASWTFRSQGLPPALPFVSPDPEILALAVDPEHPATVFAATRQGVYRSTDGAATWKQVFDPPAGLEVQTLATGPGGKVYLGAWSPNFSDELFWASQDGGDTWGVPSIMAGGVFGLQVDPDDGDDVYAAIGSVIGRTSNGGATWDYVASHQGTVAVAVDPVDPDLVYAGSRFLGVYVSTGEAATSGPLNTGLWNQLVTALATDPLSPGTVYVGLFGGGVYRLDRR